MLMFSYVDINIMVKLGCSFSFCVLLISCVNTEFIIERKSSGPDILQYQQKKPKILSSNFIESDSKSTAECKIIDNRARFHIASISHDTWIPSCHTFPELQTVCGLLGETFTLKNDQSKIDFNNPCGSPEILSLQIWGIRSTKDGEIRWQEFEKPTSSEIKVTSWSISFVNPEKWSGLVMNIKRRCYSGTVGCVTLKFVGKRKYPFNANPNLDSFLASNQVTIQTTKTPIFTPSQDEKNGGDKSTNTGAIIGAVFAVFFVLFFVVLVIFLFKRRRKRFRNSQKKRLTSEEVYAKCEVDITPSQETPTRDEKFSVRVHGTNEYASVSSGEPEYREIEPEPLYDKYDKPDHKVPVESLDKTKVRDDVYHTPSELNKYEDEITSKEDTYHLPDVSEPLLEDTAGDDPDYYSTPIINEKQTTERPLSEMYAKVVK